ncbi:MULTISPECIES: hypothetical protein [unclassified Streptomyces]|uniref:hypothetical protein n=1 Tax=unclassified Streptomyces TaxID=2593676 RepID=UPI0037FDF3E6
MGRMTYGRSMVAGTIAAAAVATALTAGPAAAQPAAKGQSAQQTERSVQIKGTRHTTNRNVELVIGTSASGSRVKLGTVTVELEDVLGHAGASYTFRLYVGGKRLKNTSHVCTYGECARQWHINKTFKKGTKVTGTMLPAGSSKNVGAPSFKL